MVRSKGLRRASRVRSFVIGGQAVYRFFILLAAVLGVAVLCSSPLRTPGVWAGDLNENTTCSRAGGAPPNSTVIWDTVSVSSGTQPATWFKFTWRSGPIAEGWPFWATLDYGHGGQNEQQCANRVNEQAQCWIRTYDGVQCTGFTKLYSSIGKQPVFVNTHLVESYRPYAQTCYLITWDLGKCCGYCNPMGPCYAIGK